MTEKKRKKKTLTKKDKLMISSITGVKYTGSGKDKAGETDMMKDLLRELRIDKMTKHT